MADTLTAPRHTWLTSKEAAHLIGVTYRQLDYAARVVVDFTPGSGNWRSWPPNIIVRLAVAKALYDTLDWLHHPGISSWTRIVRHVIEGPEPIDRGLVTLTPTGHITYHRSRLEGIGPGLTTLINLHHLKEALHG